MRWPWQPNPEDVQARKEAERDLRRVLEQRLHVERVVRELEAIVAAHLVSVCIMTRRSA